MTSEVKEFRAINPMTVGEIISRSWRLYRLNFIKVFLYSLLAAPLMTIGQILINIPSAMPEMMQAPDKFGQYCCFSTSGCVFLYIGYGFGIFFYILLFKAFSNILNLEDFSYKAIFGFAKRYMGEIILFTIILLSEIVIFYIIDVILAIILIIIATIITMALNMLIWGSNSLDEPLAGFLLFFFIIITVILVGLIMLYQFLICSLQITIFTTEKVSFKGTYQSLIKSLDVIANNFWRSTGFSISLIFLLYFLTLFFQAPPILYTFWVIIKEGMMNISQEGYPISLIIISSIWSSAVSILILPMIISAVTLFYYDIKVRTEGFDLKQYLIQNKKNLNQI